MTAPLPSTQLAPEKPTPSIEHPRVAWAGVLVSVFIFLLVCAALILVAAWRGA